MSYQTVILMIGIAALIVAFANALYSHIRPKLVISGPKLTTLSDRFGSMAVKGSSDKKAHFADLAIFGFVVDLTPSWDIVARKFRPLELAAFIENRSTLKTAKEAKILVPRDGEGYTVLIKDSQEVEFQPSEPVFKPSSTLRCKELGDIGPRVKHPVTLIFQFAPFPDLLALYENAAAGYVGGLRHDYYITAQDLKCQSKVMVINLILPGFTSVNTRSEAESQRIKEHLL